MVATRVNRDRVIDNDSAHAKRLARKRGIGLAVNLTKRNVTGAYGHCWRVLDNYSLASRKLRKGRAQIVGEQYAYHVFENTDDALTRFTRRTMLHQHASP